jgi:hypothetical protein
MQCETRFHDSMLVVKLVSLPHRSSRGSHVSVTERQERVKYQNSASCSCVTYNTVFHENPSSDSKVIRRGRHMDMIYHKFIPS